MGINHSDIMCVVQFKIADFIIFLGPLTTPAIRSSRERHFWFGSCNYFYLFLSVSTKKYVNFRSKPFQES